MVVVRQGADKRFYAFRHVKRPYTGGKFKVGCKISSTFKVRQVNLSNHIVHIVTLGSVAFPASFKGKLVQFVVEVVDKEKYEEEK